MNLKPVCVCTCLCARPRASVHVFACARVCMYECVCVCMCVLVCVCTLMVWTCRENISKIEFPTISRFEEKERVAGIDCAID